MKKIKRLLISILGIAMLTGVSINPVQARSFEPSKWEAD